MAIITKGITGGFSGKVGTVVGSVKNGTPVLQSLPAHMSSNSILNLEKGQVSVKRYWGLWSDYEDRIQRIFNTFYSPTLNYKGRVYLHSTKFQNVLSPAVLGVLIYNPNPLYLGFSLTMAFTAANNRASFTMSRVLDFQKMYGFTRVRRYVLPWFSGNLSPLGEFFGLNQYELGVRSDDFPDGNSEFRVLRFFESEKDFDDILLIIGTGFYVS